LKVGCTSALIERGKLFRKYGLRMNEGDQVSNRYPRGISL
jgi:hypothetical protein